MAACQSTLISPPVKGWWLSPPPLHRTHQDALSRLHFSSIKQNSRKDTGRWSTALKQTPAPLWSPPTRLVELVSKATWTRRSPHKVVLPWSHFPNNTTVAALAVTWHSSDSSSRMGGDRLYPCCPCQQPSLNMVCFIQSRWGGRTRWRNRTKSVKLRGQKKCSIQSLAGTQAHDRGSSRKLSRCLTVCSRLIKRKIRQSGNQPTGNAALHLPGEHQ